MDIYGGSFQAEFLGTPMMLGTGSRRSSAESTQVSGGLMRYHSAPSSMLASLVDEDFFPRGSSPLSQGEDSEFARFLTDDLATSSSLCDSRDMQLQDKPQTGPVMNGIEAEPRLTDHSDRTRMMTQHSRYMRAGGNGIPDDVSRGSLSAIFENGLEEPPDGFCNSDIPVTCNQQVAQTGLRAASDSSSRNPHGTSGSNFSSLPQAKSNLIRHSSSPADFLSRLAMEESSERPSSHFTGSFMHTTAECLPESTSRENGFTPATTVPSFSTRNCFNAARGAPQASDDLIIGGSLELPSIPNRNGLLRQSSSPAGLLSQLSLDGIAAGGEKLSMSSSSGNSSEEGSFDRKGGATFLANYTVGGWDEVGTGSGNGIAAMQNGVEFGPRKRGREIEAKMFPGLALPDSQRRDVLDQSTSPTNHFSMPPTTSPGSGITMERSSPDSVPCRARAKRGCATHPRSIAERVRRTKISERMRKLQELVPNMDKQTNTADMLDEAVEYVKFLQRQVQELSENRPKCDGRCKQKGNTSLQV